MTTTTATGPASILIDVVGGVGILTLNRPKALNALSVEMIRELSEALHAWTDDPAVVGVFLRGAPRPGTDGKPGAAHFCAGGDIRFMHEAATTSDPSLDDFFTEEYALDHLIHRYPKPVVAWLDGVTMGGGMGLAQGASLRVVTASTRMAMPETRIGLFPDVAGGYFLSRCPGYVGEYLGIVGPHFGAGDALAFGLADGFAPGKLTPGEVMADLLSHPCASGEAFLARIRSLLQGGSAEPAPEPQPILHPHLDRINEIFGLPTLADISAALKEDKSEWAQQTLTLMAGHSPLMMCVTLEQIRRARGMDLADEFRMERDIVRHCFALRKGRDSETVEGVRALAIDKDNQPRWNPPELEDVTPDMVAAFFDSPWPARHHPLRDLR